MGMQCWMKRSPGVLEHHSLTKAQLSAARVLTYPRPTYIQSFCRMTHPEIRDLEFLLSLKDAAREDMVILV